MDFKIVLFYIGLLLVTENGYRTVTHHGDFFLTPQALLTTVASTSFNLLSNIVLIAVPDAHLLYYTA